jgi:methyl-accepting chemotaxis protein
MDQTPLHGIDRTPFAADPFNAMLADNACRTDLGIIAERLEAARSLIEERFLAGGTALMAAHDIVGHLLDALDGVVGSLDDNACEAASARVEATLSGLAALAKAEDAARARLATILADGEAIGPRIRDMQGSLRYLATCAVETRIAGAGVPEFVTFADDVAKYVASAVEQVNVFSGRVNELNGQIAIARNAGGAGVTDEMPSLFSTLHGALQAVRRHHGDLARLASAASKAARAVQAKVATVLAALQIGDMTRQRIEHVQTGIATLQELLAACAEPAAATALKAVGHKVLAAQTAALMQDFVSETRTIVATIDGFSEDARRILDLSGRATGDCGQTLKAIETGVGEARGLVSEVAAASRLANEAYAATKRVATELLNNMGNIGNLRNVRDDIRCLAINAYLRSNRLGDKGRAVGVVAAEMNTYATRLGVAAEGILGCLSAMDKTAAEIASQADTVDLVSELDGAMLTLREASGRTDRAIAETARNGNAAAERIGRIAAELDFRHGLGDLLDECRVLFGSAAALTGAPATDPAFADFSGRLYRLYTMAGERDVHRRVLAVGLPSETAPAPTAAAADSLLDDALF